MPAAEKNTGIIYRCPLCLMTLTDVVIDLYDDGLYHCVKCGCVVSHEELLSCYAQIRSRYKLLGQRITLEQQREL